MRRLAEVAGRARRVGFEAARQHAIDREGAAAADHDREPDGEGENVVLESFAGLVAGPVHEEPVVGVGQHDRHGHHHAHAERRPAPEQAQDQAEPAEELGDDGQKGEERRNVQILGEESHRAVVAEAAEPSQQLLRAVRENHQPEGEPQNERDRVVVGGNELAKHGYRRNVMVSLTGPGRKFIARHFPGHAAAIAGAFKALTAAEQRELGRLCKKLGRAV